MKRKFSCLILEDDLESAELLLNILAQTDLFDAPLVTSTLVQAVILLNSQAIDLLFLDIELQDGSGLELLKLFPQHPPIVAISSYPPYAVDCYDSDVADFITKPITYSRLLRALRRTILRAVAIPVPGVSTLSQPAPEAMVSPPSASTLPSSHVYLKTGRKVERFELAEILYFESFTIYVKLIRKAMTSVINEKISFLESQLSNPPFLRVHKSYLINVDQITQFDTNTIWIGAHKIPIGVTYKERVHLRLNGLGLSHS